MLKENYFNRFKELPEHIKQFSGLTILVVVVLLSFFVLNNMFGEEYVSNGYYYTYDISSDTNPSGVQTFDGAGYYPQATTNFLLGLTMPYLKCNLYLLL